MRLDRFPREDEFGLAESDKITAGVVIFTYVNHSGNKMFILSRCLVWAALLTWGLTLEVNAVEFNAGSGVPESAVMASASAANVSYRTLAHWSTGFVGEVTIVNSTAQPIEMWRVDVGLQARVIETWGARLKESTDDKLVFAAQAWNQVIAPGKTARYGFLSGTPLRTTDVPALSLRDMNDDIEAADTLWQQSVARQEGLAVQQSWAELMVFSFTRFESLTPARTGHDLIEKDPIEEHVHRRFERVRLQTFDGLVIKGVFFPVPRAKGTLILLHGHSNTYFETLPLAQLLAERGYQVFAYNSREWNFYREPETFFNDLRKDGSDLAAAMRYLHGRRDVDPQRIGVMGLSYGAAKALVAAPRIPELKVVILEGANSVIPTFNPAIPWESVKEDFIARFAARLGATPDEITTNLDLIPLVSPRPVLIIHGQNDPAVPIAEAWELFAGAGEPKSLLVLPNSGHVNALSTTDRELYLSRLSAFLDRYLGSVRP